MASSKNYFIIITVCLAFFMLASTGGCKNDNITGPLSTAEGELIHHNFGAGIYAENNGGDNTVIISNAKMVMRQLRLQANNSQLFQTVREDPFVVYIDFYQRVLPIAVAKLQPGGFHMIKFQIHKPSPNENISDPDFTGTGNTRYSFIIRGFYNGTPFTYRSQLTCARGVNIEGHPAFVVEGTVLYITLRINPYEWFNRNGVVMDPTDEGNRHDIDDNIRDSFRRAFKDLDRNGQPDNTRE